MALSEFFHRQMPRSRPSPKAVKKMGRWSRRGHHYMKYTGGLRDSDLVLPDPQLEKKIFQLIEQAYPLIAQSFDRHLGPMANHMFKTWPYETGLSLGLLGFEWEVTDTSLGGSIVCRAPYAYFIREGRKGKKRGRKIARELTPGELAITAKPPRGVSRDEWRQAMITASRQVDLVDYAYAKGVLSRIKGAQKKRRAPRKGRRVVDALVFDPGKVAAGAIYDDILNGLGKA